VDTLGDEYRRAGGSGFSPPLLLGLEGDKGFTPRIGGEDWMKYTIPSADDASEDAAAALWWVDEEDSVIGDERGEPKEPPCGWPTATLTAREAGTVRWPSSAYCGCGWSCVVAACDGSSSSARGNAVLNIRPDAVTA
jgi:hypothetical protein